MSISEDHDHDFSHIADAVKTSQPELVEQAEMNSDFTSLEKQQRNALAEGVASYQPVEGVDYSVTFKTWLVVAVGSVF